MSITQCQVGFIFLLALVFTAHLSFSWFSFEELRRKKKAGVGFLGLIPSGAGTVFFLSAAVWTAYFFAGWAARGFVVTLP